MLPVMNHEEIKSHFGAAFYAKVVACLRKYALKWRLSGFEQIDYYSVNCLFTCMSEQYGPCILKIGNDSKAAENEYHILLEYAGTRFCTVYEADPTNGVLLLEKIIPGTRLREEPDLDKRLSLFYELSRGLHKKPADRTVYPTYMDWIGSITAYMRSRKDYGFLYAKMADAERICRMLYDKYADEMLLHGDLHHDNILADENNRYRIIDPKGVIGNPVFDIPRFILNEFGDEKNEDFCRKIVHITRTLSLKFNIPESDIRRLTYVEMCMANCWDVESRQEPNMDDVLFTERLMKGIPL